MKTSIDLIFKVLSKLEDGNLPLEIAIKQSQEETQLPILDEVKNIRQSLVEKQLLKHNSRLTFIVKEYIDNGTSFVNNEIHEDFINDYITESCISMLKNNLLLEFLLAEYGN